MSAECVVIAFHSGFGHTARQAEAVGRGASSVVGVTAQCLDVSRLDDGLWAALDRADAIVFGTPTYMGSQSAAFQSFAEASSAVWAVQGWRDKLAAGFTNSAGINGDKLHTLSRLSILAAQHVMTWINLGLLPGWLYTSGGSIDDLNRLGGFIGAMAQSPSDQPAELAPSSGDLRTAEYLGRRVAQASVRWRRGASEVAGFGSRPSVS